MTTREKNPETKQGEEVEKVGRRKRVLEKFLMLSCVCVCACLKSVFYGKTRFCERASGASEPTKKDASYGIIISRLIACTTNSLSHPRER